MSPQKSCRDRNRWPRNLQQCRQQQDGAEMNDRRAAKRGRGRRRIERRPLGNKSHDDELQADQGARSRADYYVEAVPIRNLRHGATHPPNRSRR